MYASLLFDVLPPQELGAVVSVSGVGLVGRLTAVGTRVHEQRAKIECLLVTARVVDMDKVQQLRHDLELEHSLRTTLRTRWNVASTRHLLVADQ